jgi:hypothetical protein
VQGEFLRSGFLESKRVWAGRPNSVDVLMKRRMDDAPKRIENEIDAFAPREFSRGDKIRISGHQDYLIDLTFEAQRGDVKSDTHIHALLKGCIFKVVVDQTVEVETAIQKLLEPSVS